ALTRPAGEALPRFVVRFPPIERHARLTRVDEERAGRWIEGGWPEIRAAGDVGARNLSGFVGCMSGLDHRAAVAPDLFRPCRLHERFGEDEAAVGAIDRVVEAVAVGETHDFRG